MDGKDWLLVLAAIVIFGGPVGHAVWKRSRGNIHKSPAGETFLTDYSRLGSAVTAVGGRALAEGAKLMRFGALRYTNDQTQKDMQKVGGA